MYCLLLYVVQIALYLKVQPSAMRGLLYEGINGILQNGQVRDALTEFFTSQYPGRA